eukprot:163929-Amphidinium_carterae.1
MEQARANSLQWSACDNACGHTTQQWARHASDSRSDNLTLFDHNDSPQPDRADLEQDNFLVNIVYVDISDSDYVLTSFVP